MLPNYTRENLTNPLGDLHSEQSMSSANDIIVQQSSLYNIAPSKCENSRLLYAID